MTRLGDVVKAARSLRPRSASGGGGATRKGESAPGPGNRGSGPLAGCGTTGPSPPAGAAAPTPKQQKKAPTPKIALSPTEAAEALGISRDSFDRHIRPELPVVYRGRLVLIPVKALDDWLEKNARKQLG